MRERSAELRSATNVSLASLLGAQAAAAWGPLVLALAALVIWARSLPLINMRALSDLGVLTVLTPAAFLAVALLAASFSLALRPEQPRVPVLLVHMAVLIVVLDGIPILVNGTPSRPDAWRHVGIAEYIQRNGSVDPTFNAYFGWPSFFVLSAFLTDVLGLGSANELVVWAPIFFNLLYLGPLLLILRSTTQSQRLPWLGVWLFYLMNWVGQDYFAPQALAYLFYLTMIGILIRWFSVSPDPHTSRLGALVSRLHGSRVVRPLLQLPAVQPRSEQAVGLLAVVFLIFSVVVSGHQLTPFIALVTVGALVLFGLCPMRGLLVAMAVMVAGWILYEGWAFFSGHIITVINNIGQLNATLDANVAERIIGSPGHVLVVRMRLVVSVALWILSGIGAVRRLRNGYQDLCIVVIALAPFCLLPLESYGGEMVIRVYLFSLPAMIFFAATFIFSEPHRRMSWLKTGAVALLSMGLFGIFLITRYGDERINDITTQQIEAVQYVYKVAPPGSLLVAAGPNTSWQFQDVEKYRYAEFELRSVQDLEALRQADVAAVERKMDAGGSAPAFLIVTRSQEMALEDIDGLPPGTLDRLVARLTASGRFRAAFRNDDAAVLVRSDQPSRAAE